MEKSIACKVDGMTCGNCAMSITNYLQKEGVKNAVANSSTGDLILHYSMMKASWKHFMRV
jgi:Cu+-exporting ATPase